MKQKVSLASVLAGGAELVFLDEPTLGLDVESSRTLRRELRRLAREEGLTIVLSSHDMGVIEDVCDRVVMMANGQIVADDTVTALLSGTDRDGIRVVSADIDEAVVATLRERFDVRGVETGLGAGERDGSGSAAVEVAAAGDGLYDLMDALREAGVTVEDVQTVRPELEDVFVDLTGMEGDGSERSVAVSRGDSAASDGGSHPASATTEPADEPRPATYYHLARAVLYREYLIFVRYPANAIGGIVVALFFFGVLFYGGRLLAGQALTDSISGIIVGYFLWTLSVGAYSSVSSDIGSEVQWGP